MEPGEIGLTLEERRLAESNAAGTVAGWEPRAVRLTARAVLFVSLLAYPACGDWTFTERRSPG